jgi:tetraacyldisaccharide 4'-kinase
MPDFLWSIDESPRERLWRAPLLPLEWAYRGIVWSHRSLYERGLLRRSRLPCRVVSVGNLTVGGSGKTPLVGWLACALRDAGQKVAILSRGVGGRRIRGVNVVSDGERILLPASEAGDEPVLLATIARGVPVLSGRNRAALGLRASALFGVDVVLLDDGFQHHRLQRDLDLVCVDASLGLGNGHVLPRGPLREPRRALRRADALVFTRLRPGRSPRGAGVPPECPRFHVEIAPRRLRVLGGGALPVTALDTRPVGLLAGIARPDRLERDLAALGARVATRRIFPDHHVYSREDVMGLQGDHPWITTAKDAVKIPPEWVAGCEVWVMEEELRCREGRALLDFVLERLTGGAA